MSQSDSSQNKPAPATGSKIGYVGTGILIGLVAYPFVRKALSKLQPNLDKVFDNLTGKAEGLAEKASDLMARAKENLYRTEDAGEAPHHAHEHDRDHASSPKKPKKSSS